MQHNTRVRTASLLGCRAHRRRLNRSPLGAGCAAPLSATRIGDSETYVGEDCICNPLHDNDVHAVMNVHAPLFGVLRLSLVMASKSVGAQIENWKKDLLKMTLDMLVKGCETGLIDGIRGYCVMNSTAFFNQIRRSSRSRSKIYDICSFLRDIYHLNHVLYMYLLYNKAFFIFSTKCFVLFSLSPHCKPHKGLQ